MIIAESIRNIFMNNGCMKNKRRAIFICDLIPVVVVLLTEVFVIFMIKIFFVEIIGISCVGVALYIVSFIFLEIYLTFFIRFYKLKRYDKI